MSLPILLRWPDELELVQNQLSETDRIAALWRREQFREAELEILPRLADNQNDLNCLILLALCSESCDRSAQHRLLLDHLSKIAPRHEMVRWLQLKYWLRILDSGAIISAGSQIWFGEHNSPFLSISRCRFLLAAQQLDRLREKLKSLDPQLKDSLEILQCEGDLAALVGDHHRALEIWRSLVPRCPGSRLILERVLKLAITCRNSEAVLSTVRLALDRFGEHPSFLSSLTAIKLHQRQPGLGQRSSLLGMLWRSLGLAEVDIANQFSCYEMNGLVDWLEYVLPSAIESPMDQQTTFSNLTMQLASITSHKYKNHLEVYASALRSSNLNALYKRSSTLKKKVATCSPLKIAWIMGDLAPHPVSRFVYQFFAGSRQHSFNHDHVLVNTFDYGKESCREWFEGLPNLPIVDVSVHQAEKRVAAIRSLNADIAIDLSGWTSNHFWVYGAYCTYSS